MQVGDLVEHTSLLGRRLGIVIDFDPEVNGVLCIMKGQKLWFSGHQLEIISESR